MFLVALTMTEQMQKNCLIQKQKHKLQGIENHLDKFKALALCQSFLFCNKKGNYKHFIQYVSILKKEAMRMTVKIDY